MSSYTKTPNEVYLAAGDPAVKRSEVVTLNDEMIAAIAKAPKKITQVSAVNLTLTAADLGAYVTITAAAAVSLPAAATAGDGWQAIIAARGGAATIDPDGSEQIEGAETLVLADSETALIVCDGSAWSATVIRGLGTLGTAATQNVGTAAGNVVQLGAGSTLPAVDGAALTKTGGMQWLTRIEATAANEIDITSFDPSRFDSYELKFHYLLPSVDSDSLRLRTSSNGGTGFDGAGSDYAYVGGGDRYGGAYQAEGGFSESGIILAVSVGVNGAAEVGATGSLEVYRPDLAKYTQFLWGAFFVQSNGNGRQTNGGGQRLQSAAVNALRLEYPLGTISGVVDFYGLRRS